MSQSMSEKIFSLPVERQITPYISLRQLDALPIIVVNHPRLQAAVALQGAHLLLWQPGGEKPALWLSPDSAFRPGEPIRGGVPICWPWFGPARQEGYPAHGFARNLPWTLCAHDEDAQGVTLTLTLTDSDASRKYWPHDFSLTARYRLSDHCSMELEADGDYRCQAALHTYFNIADINAVSVSGLGEPYLDKVNGGTGAIQQGALTFSARTDRVYTAPEAFSVIHDRGFQRSIEIHHHHHSDVVAWNPWSDIAAAMADMPNDGYHTMVCVETARVSQPLQVSSGSPGRLAATLRLRPQR
ncbi:D-hexose-6-phosphate mutarotase [Edwardsiella ictaluri]|nr:D-hexose-6-phosphate mutarotase [Edwardsiella ictaluri]AVZ80934.1 D-hexose-6-phosphate mutarotase [Edwardsiella ictaluri]STP80601.1 Putative glucose-6-phosphate 1-epimerase [Edwardsiella ictaluri]